MIPRSCRANNNIYLILLDNIVLESFLSRLCRPDNFEWVVSHQEILPARSARFKEIPSNLSPSTGELLKKAGIESLYSHQAEAISLSLSGRDVVLATSTASGKSLFYQTVVADRLIRSPNARAILLFPLKALERDQLDAFLSLYGGYGLTALVYDGDTPESERRKIRSHPPRVIITNPDMLHLGLLAHHDIWRGFFSNLECVVLDEVHTYKGIFGSHVAQLIVRLLRVCKSYGADPTFCSSSATVSNPGAFASSLTGRETAVVDESGAPSAERSFFILNPVLSPNTVATRIFCYKRSIQVSKPLFSPERGKLRN